MQQRLHQRRRLRAQRDLHGHRSVTYPECTGDISCAGQWPRTVMSTYAKGRLTGVTGWASIDHHRNQTVDEVVHANGVADP
ncbi:MAG: hypothetical protein GY722_09870, partial [bacterium]|nr:hypothetical protein [bacterium]